MSVYCSQTFPILYVYQYQPYPATRKMEAIGKSTNSYGSKRNLIDVENNGKSGLTSNRKSSSSFVVQWLFFFAVTTFTLFFIAIVIKQEYEIRAIQLELGSSVGKDDFQSGFNMHTSNNPNLEYSVKNGNQSDVIKAIHSRRRRQIDLSDSQSSMVPFVHLSGIQPSSVKNHQLERDVPYHWSNWTLDSPLNSNFALVQMHKTTLGFVQAIRVVCSGWYYVYAQLPYNWKYDSNQDTKLGHSIVKIDKCGRDNPVTVLQTWATYNRANTISMGEDWRYVGGIVYLSAATHLEVRCVRDSTCVNHTHYDMYKGGFFGLFMIQRTDEGRCFAHCA